nr:hypothetical protein [uncultured bacterium]
MAEKADKIYRLLRLHERLSRGEAIQQRDSMSLGGALASTLVDGAGDFGLWYFLDFIFEGLLNWQHSSHKPTTTHRGRNDRQSLQAEVMK